MLSCNLHLASPKGSTIYIALYCIASRDLRTLHPDDLLKLGFRYFCIFAVSQGIRRRTKGHENVVFSCGSHVPFCLRRPGDVRCSGCVASMDKEEFWRPVLCVFWRLLLSDFRKVPHHDSAVGCCACEAVWGEMKKSARSPGREFTKTLTQSHGKDSKPIATLHLCEPRGNAISTLYSSYPTMLPSCHLIPWPRGTHLRG